MARQVQVDLDLQKALLLDGDPGVAGQSLRSAGPGVPATWTDANGNTHYAQDTKPTSPGVNDSWVNTSLPSLPKYWYINDGTSTQWVQIPAQAVTPPRFGSPTFIQATTPTVEQIGGSSTYAWWQTIDGDLTLWIEDGT
jgi:hypothetical protein